MGGLAHIVAGMGVMRPSMGFELVGGDCRWIMSAPPPPMEV
jgi:hypothetical protein